MKRLTQIALGGVLLLAVLSVATAQQVPQPVVRLGNFLEVGNDVFLHIIATVDARYVTVHNRDFESRVRDRVLARNPNDTPSQVSDADAAWFLNRLGVDFRYQKSFEGQVLFEHRQIVDGNLIDDRSNQTNPGGTDIFGRGPAGEQPSFHTERYWMRYKFPGTPIKLHVGADLWNVDQAGIVGDDDPRFVIFGEFGDIDVMAGAVVQFESQRLGLENDNDEIYYTFSAGYNLKPHRFQLDVVYFRDRFRGADTFNPAVRPGVVGVQGQKTDTVHITGGWTGRVGPVRALVQGMLAVGTERGGTAGLPAGVRPGRDYDVFAGGVVTYAEVDLGIVRPFVSFIYGSGDGDPRDNELHGFGGLAHADVTQITGVSWFAHLDTSTNFAGRDYACPARAQGIRQAAPAGNPLAIGGAVLGGAPPSGAECSHTVSNPFNQRLASRSHLGLLSVYSNPGTLLLTGGLRVFPLKGHEIVGWYVYRGMVTSNLLEVAFAPELAAAGGPRSIGNAQIHEIGGFWMWTVNPHFDIRLSGHLALLGDGFKDIARFADCNPAAAGLQRCDGDDLALKAEARFRARF